MIVCRILNVTIEGMVSKDHATPMNKEICDNYRQQNVKYHSIFAMQIIFSFAFSCLEYSVGPQALRRFPTAPEAAVDFWDLVETKRKNLSSSFSLEEGLVCLLL